MSPAPLLLDADNFTAPARTPWGGRKLVERYKRHVPLDPEKRSQTVVGESWELSTGPELPSRCALDEQPLASVLASDPQGYLGCEAERGHVATALVVKLLDAADNLSVQIHPDDAYPALAADETGKPECWYVVEREPDAGLYFGFRESTSPREVADALQHGHDLSPLLQWVPAEPGDFFLVDPGTAHAVGKGVTLVEPQRMTPGKRGVTYRYWDWNRRYDAAGKPSDSGRPRALHVDHALAVTDWQRGCGKALLERSHFKAGAADPEAPAQATPLCGPSSSDGLQSSTLRAIRVHGTGTLDRLPRWDTLTALTVLEGTVEIDTGSEILRIDGGRTAALPARGSIAGCRLEHAHAICSSIVCDTPAHRRHEP